MTDIQAYRPTCKAFVGMETLLVIFTARGLEIIPDPITHYNGQVSTVLVSELLDEDLKQ